MGLFSAIKDFIFHKQPAAPAAPAQATPQQAAPQQAAPAQPAAQAPVIERVDVAAILDKEQQASGQKLDWRHSIVDLMKLCGLDSSLEHRKELAKELNYAGDMNDSAAMNIWLHKAVLQKLEQDGGKVPEDLK